MLCCLSRVLPLRLLRPSRSPPATEPREPPEQQRTEAEADHVQDEELAVAGRQQRADQQRRHCNGNRQSPVPPDKSTEADRDALDLSNPFLDVHAHLLVC